MISPGDEKGGLRQVEQGRLTSNLWTLTIKEIQVQTLPFGKILGTYVVIKHGSEKYKTMRLDKTKSAVQWDTQFKIKTSDMTEKLSFELRRRRLFLSSSSQLLGTSQIEFSALAQSQGQGVEFPMDSANLKFIIRAISDSDSAQETKAADLSSHVLTQSETQSVSNTLQVGQMKVGSVSDSAVHRGVPVMDPALRDDVLKPSHLGTVIEAVDPVLGVLEKIVEIHPIAQIAWIAVSGIYQIVKTKHERNQAVIALYNAMIKTYEVAIEGEKWKNGEKFKPTFETMVKHSEECYMFLSDYQSDGSLRRMLRLDASKTILEYTTTFENLNDDFTSLQVRHTTQSLLRMEPRIDAIVNALDLEQKLKRLKPENARWETLGPKSECFPGTRHSTLREIIDWTVDLGRESIFWLFGVAGSGKSSLMGTLHKTMLLHMGFNSRLAAFIRFDRNDYNDARMLIRSLAYQLAEFDPRLGQAIANAVSQNPQIVDTPDLSMQLKHLILEPLGKQHHLTTEGPIVVIIDGLDECTRADSTETNFRRQVLDLLVDNPFRLFPYLRLIVASRPEEDIKGKLTGRKHIVSYPLDITSDKTKEDVKRFIDKRLGDFEKDKPGLIESYPGSREYVVDQLSQRASGLFIWASTVIAFVAGYPERRLPLILETEIPTDALGALTILYKTALDAIAGEHGGNADIQTDIRLLLGRIMASNSLGIVPFFGPLTQDVLDGPIIPNSNGVAIRSLQPVLQKLWSVIQVEEESSNLTFLHKSFDDFLVDKTRCPTYYIDLKEYSPEWALICIRYLTSYMEKNTKHPSRSGGVDVAFHEFAIYCWSEFLGKVECEDVKARPELLRVLTSMLQTYLLRWMSLGPWYFASNQSTQNISRLFGLAIFSKSLPTEMEAANDPQNFERLVHDSSEFSNSLRGILMTLEKAKERVRWPGWDDHLIHGPDDITGTMIFLFRWLCRKSSNIMNRYYMPAFIAMASGSKRYPDIIAAIEKDPTPPIMDLSSLDLGSQIEILEVPEELVHTEHNDDNDGDPVWEYYNVNTDKTTDQDSDSPENQFNA